MVSATTGIPKGLRELASLQADVISRPQALRSGMTPDAIKWAVRGKTWQPVYPGIYATFTGQLSRSALLWASLLYAGEGALLSHQTAAELLGLIDRQAAQAHVLIPHRRQVRPSPGMVVHTSRRAMPKWRFARGTPSHTMPEDTVIDLVNAARYVDEAAGWIPPPLPGV